MADRYLFSHKGLVEEVYLPGKAVLSFTINDEPQRALLWVKGFYHKGNKLEQTDNFHGKLSPGETIYFDCHIYDRESKDNCGWYALRAWKGGPGESPPMNLTQVVNHTGYIYEVDIAKGVIVFDINEEEQRVFFLRTKCYYFGKKVSNKYPLNEFLFENDPVQFDAEMCDPTSANYMCNWFASIVWKGKKPVPGTNASTPSSQAAETASTSSEREIPGLPPGLVEKETSKKEGLKSFERNSGNIREGKGHVGTIINEESGVALWLMQPNAWQTVYFHRSNCFLGQTPLAKFDLSESLEQGSLLDITAVPAVTDFPCKWIAQKVIATS